MPNSTAKSWKNEHVHSCTTLLMSSPWTLLLGEWTKDITWMYSHSRAKLTSKVRGLSSDCSWAVHGLLTSSRRTVHELLTSKVHGLSSDCSWAVHGLLTSKVHGLSSDCSWAVHGLSDDCISSPTTAASSEKWNHVSYRDMGKWWYPWEAAVWEHQQKAKNLQKWRNYLPCSGTWKRRWRFQGVHNYKELTIKQGFTHQRNSVKINIECWKEGAVYHLYSKFNKNSKMADFLVVRQPHRTSHSLQILRLMSSTRKAQ